MTEKRPVGRPPLEWVPDVRAACVPGVALLVDRGQNEYRLRGRVTSRDSTSVTLVDRRQRRHRLEFRQIARARVIPSLFLAGDWVHRIGLDGAYLVTKATSVGCVHLQATLGGMDVELEVHETEVEHVDDRVEREAEQRRAQMRIAQPRLKPGRRAADERTEAINQAAYEARQAELQTTGAGWAE